MRAVLPGVMPYILLVFVTLLVMFYRLDTYPVAWFDEGYKMNAARTLAERGVFGSYTVNGYIPFDPGISSGPLDLLPVAWMFQAFGATVSHARLVSIFFTLVSVLSLYKLGNMLYGKKTGLFIALFALAVPTPGDTGLLMIGRQILGEPAALGCTLLGLWMWFRSWETGSWILAILSGLVMGVGLLSKTQVAIPLLPALVIVGGLRWLKYRQDLLKLAAPSILAVAVVGGWMLVGRFNTPPDIAQENSAMLMDAIRTNLITPLLGRGLHTTGIVTAQIIGLGILFVIRRIFIPPVDQRLKTDEQWEELAIGIFLVFMALWYILLSIGWPRYAYVGTVVAFIPIGKTLWNAWDKFRRWRGWTNPTAYRAVIAILIIAVLAVNLYPATKAPAQNAVEAVADYIDANIPQDAVIETWEWEIDALTEHWAFHHPHQRYLFESIRQIWHDEDPFHLQYNLLEGDPDYLITGTFSTWTRIYPSSQIRANFEEIASFDAYTIYRRRPA